MVNFICMRTTRPSTIYVAALCPDKVAGVLNVVLQKLNGWCCRIRITPHPGKTEYMLLMRRQFIRPLQPILLRNNLVDRVESTRCLGA